MKNAENPAEASEALGLRDLWDQELEDTEVKLITITEDAIAEIIKMAANEGAKEGVSAYKRELEMDACARTEKVRNSAKMLVKHYRKLKRMKDTSVYDTDTVTDPTLREIFAEMLDQCRKGEFDLTSTKKNSIVTGMMMNHVDVQLENYRRECEKSSIPEIQRRYRVVEMMFLQDTPLRADEVAEIENIDKSNVYRTLEKAYDDLTALFFGVEGLNVVEYRKSLKKKNRK